MTTPATPPAAGSPPAPATTPTPGAAPAFRLAYVPGVTPAKWVRIWHERRPDRPLELVQCPDTGAALARLSDDGAAAALVRLPLPAGLPTAAEPQAITLYREATVAVVPKDHLVTAADAVTAADLADEPVLIPLDDPLTWPDRPGTPVAHRPADVADTIELVAAGTGIALLPQSVARLHHRRDLTYRPVTDGPETPVALIWPAGATSDDVEALIGIVRGRSVNSSRGRGDEPAPKRTAREKTLAKQAARAAAGKKSTAAPSNRKPGAGRAGPAGRRRR